MTIRALSPADFEPLTTLWHEGWQDAHARLLPAELARHRTREAFAQRLHKHAGRVRVAGAIGAPHGFHIVDGDELYQLYVAREARGTDLAPALLADAEACIRAGGHGRAWLACAIGNERAAHFYDKHGWQLVGAVTIHPATPVGPFPLEVWRFEKALGGTAA